VITLCRATRRAALATALSVAFATLASVRASAAPVLPERGLFPSDRWTVRDHRQNTERRVDLPLPPCDERPSDCADIGVINTLDGFNLQPRLTIPFDSPIDVSTVSSQSVFLVSLGSTLPGGPWPGHVVGINQVVWDPASLTLFAEADELLDQHTRYLFVVTDRVRGLDGRPASPADRSRGFLAEAAELLERFAHPLGRGVRPLAATVFTTQSATSTLEKVRRQIKDAVPAPAELDVADGFGPAIFPLADLSSIVFNRQIGTSLFASLPVPLPALAVAPGAVGQIAFGHYLSPDYETAQGFIPPVPSLSGIPAVQRLESVAFTLFVPAGVPPASGWPVAIFGHGLGDNKNNSPFAVAAVLAAHGIATIAINVVGHGGGAAGTLVVNTVDGRSLIVPAGGRGVDQNGDGLIGPFEGVQALPPNSVITARDGLQQTVIDLMQLVREIEVGVDLDGDGQPDLDAARISYVGQSFGGMYGAMLLAVEPRLATGALNSFGGSNIDVLRLGGFRPLLTAALAARAPSLLNVPGGFDEDLPLRNQPPVVDPVAGAIEIQEVLEDMEWATQAANAVSYAPHLRKAPLRGVGAKSVLLQFARGDETVPNPTASAVVRAGGLLDRTTLFRNDLAFALDPSLPRNPHSFLTRLDLPSAAAFAIAAQQQIATFLGSSGRVTVDPDGPGPLFEVPIVPPLPEDLAFLP
jgi:hypothetical protein